MATQTRKHLRAWLKQIDVKGTVVDVGGVSWPIFKQTKTWDVPVYKIYDLKDEKKNVKTDYICDLNTHFSIKEKFDIAFCTEVMQFVYNPVIALQNINELLVPEGKLYITFHLTHSPMKGKDYLRYTEKGLRKLLDVSGFKINNLEEPFDGFFLVKATCLPYPS